jgi:LmbE family N-acetylglucosaminyl deacetylase
VVAAHPDDEVLGAGGAIVRHARVGDVVSLVILTDGAGTRYAATMARRLREDCLRAARVLGARRTVFLDLPNQKLDTLPILEVVTALERTFEDLRPQVVFTHHAGDLNRDHRVAHEATLVACRPLPGQSVRRLYAYSVVSSTEWAAPTAADAFLPNVFLDISDVLDVKLRAFGCYRSEARRHPHARSRAGVRVAAQRAGLGVGLSAAEPFMLLRGIETLA